MPKHKSTRYIRNGMRVWSALEQKNQNINSLAVAMERHRSYISTLLNGHIPVSVDIAKRLIGALENWGIETKELFEYREAK